MIAPPAAYWFTMAPPQELPAARVRSARTFASRASSFASSFASGWSSLGLHVGNGLRRARQLARWGFTALMALVVLAYLVGRFLSWTSPPRAAEPSLPANLPPDLMQQLEGVEVIERPAAGGGTVRTLGRKPRPAALEESAQDEPASEPTGDAPAAPPSLP